MTKILVESLCNKYVILRYYKKKLTGICTLPDTILLKQILFPNIYFNTNIFNTNKQ